MPKTIVNDDSQWSSARPSESVATIAASHASVIAAGIAYWAVRRHQCAISIARPVASRSRTGIEVLAPHDEPRRARSGKHPRPSWPSSLAHGPPKDRRLPRARRSGSGLFATMIARQGERAPRARGEGARAMARRQAGGTWRSSWGSLARAQAAIAESSARPRKPESTDGLGCAGCRARNGRFGGCGSGWWRWQGATVAVRACGQEETAVGRRSQACWRQAVERSARPSGVRSGAGSPAAGRGRR